MPATEALDVARTASITTTAAPLTSSVVATGTTGSRSGRSRPSRRSTTSPHASSRTAYSAARATATMMSPREGPGDEGAADAATETPTPNRNAPLTVCPSTWLTVRSEEHTSELQSRVDLVCRLLLEKKKNKK